MRMTLTLVAQEHLDQLAALAKTIWNEYFISIISQGQIDYMLEKFQSQQALLQAINEGYQYYFMTTSEGNIVGYTAIRLEYPSMFLSKFYILKEARGQGYGRKALNQLVDLAISEKCERIWLTVNRYNLETIALYKHVGFRIVEEKAADIGGGYVMDDYILELCVNNYARARL